MLGKCSTQSYILTLYFSLIQGHAILPRLTSIHCILGEPGTFLFDCFFYVGVGDVRVLQPCLEVRGRLQESLLSFHHVVQGLRLRSSDGSKHFTAEPSCEAYS